MKKRICLIDDEKDFTELAGALLGFSGFDVETHNDPAAAFERLKGEQFDAVVMDIMMPGMDGFELIEALRGVSAYADKPLFALSCKELNEAERKLLISRRVRFVAKPFEPRRLVEMIRESLTAA